MDLETFRSLLTPVGQDALRAAEALAPREEQFLRHYQQLKPHFPDELAKAALEIAILREEAVVKFPQAGAMYFTRQALEQASAYAVSSYRAQRYRAFPRVFDLGCSIGGDTLALAEVTYPVGVDADELRLAMASANLKALGLPGAFVRADLTIPLPWQSKGAIFFDPARRSQGRRIYHVEEYHPPLSTVNAWLGDFPAIGVKISPGVDISQLLQYDAEVEFISYKGALKEAVLWFGEFRRGTRRATLLPGEYTLSDDEPPQLPLGEPAGYLYEPDPAVIRAGLVGTLGVQLGAHQLDKDIAYLVAPRLQVTPFARVWHIEDWFPFQLKRLRAYLRQRDVGRVTVKKRGSPITPEQLIRDLRLRGDLHKTLFLTHLRGKPIVIISESASPNQPWGVEAEKEQF